MQSPSRARASKTLCEESGPKLRRLKRNASAIQSSHGIHDTPLLDASIFKNFRSEVQETLLHSLHESEKHGLKGASTNSPMGHVRGGDRAT